MRQKITPLHLRSWVARKRAGMLFHDAPTYDMRELRV